MKLTLSVITSVILVTGVAPKMQMSNIVIALVLMLIAFACVGIDLATGVLKAYVKKEVRTSSGYRKTVKKFGQYGGAIVVGFLIELIVWFVNKYVADIKWLVGSYEYVLMGALAYIILIEITSMLENLYAIDQSSKFSIYFIRPLLAVLTLQLRNNPVFKSIENQKTKEAQNDTDTLV